MNRQEKFAQLLVGVHSFYERELTDFALRIWCDALADMPFDDIERAFALHVKDPERGRFMPKPADVIAHGRGTVEDRARVAWGAVLGSVRGGGADAQQLQDPATVQALQAMGGRSVIARADESQNRFLEHQFVELFAAFLRRDERSRVQLTDELVQRLTTR